MAGTVRKLATALLLMLGVTAATAAEEFPIPPGFESGFKDVDGVKLHYVKGGSGPVVLLVHGFGQAWYEWHQLMPILARDHTVIAPDLPGLGLSSPTSGSYAGQDISEVLYHFTQTFTRGSRFDLVAHDIGIWNTYPMAVMHQADIRRVIFMEAPIPDKSIYAAPAFTPEGPSLLYHFSFFTAEDDIAEKLIAGREEIFLDYFIKTHAVNKRAFTPELVNLYARSYAKLGVTHASFAYYRALNETVRRDEPLGATKIRIPVLAIGGAGSFGEGQVAQVRNYATDVQGASLANCGHWLPEECPELLNPLVVAFLKN